jgi:hypothetical protein
VAPTTIQNIDLSQGFKLPRTISTGLNFYKDETSILPKIKKAISRNVVTHNKNSKKALNEVEQFMNSQLDKSACLIRAKLELATETLEQLVPFDISY